MRISYLRKTTVLFLLLISASPVFASAHPEVADKNTEIRALALESRLAEIKAMDKAQLSRTEKKALRREVREIKKELAVASGGVYLSVGAILLIALLLILLL